MSNPNYQLPTYLRSGFPRGGPALYHAGCAAADAAPALSVRGRLPRAGKRAPLIPSLRSRARRVRDALRRPMRCGRCASGCQHSTDRWARTRRGESLRPFSRARAQSGRSACLAPDVLGRPRPALRHRQPCPVIIDCGTTISDSGQCRTGAATITAVTPGRRRPAHERLANHIPPNSQLPKLSCSFGVGRCLSSGPILLPFRPQKGYLLFAVDND